MPTAHRLPHIILGFLDTPPGARIRPRERLAPTALTLSPSDRELLDLVGRQPVLSLAQLAALRARPVWQLRRQWVRLADGELIRAVQADEVQQPQRGDRRGTGTSDDIRGPMNHDIDGLRLTELTEKGLALLTATWGFPPRTAARLNALVGGGRQRAFGPRSPLLTHLARTIEANEAFVEFARAVRQRAEGRKENAVITWRSAATCARGALRPDAYGMVDAAEQSLGFFLEYDRGTESFRDYRRKFAAYYRYAETGRFELDYEGFPTILIITTSPGAEDRIAKAICAVSVGQTANLPFLLTTVGLVRTSKALSDPIWRDPWGATRR